MAKDWLDEFIENESEEEKNSIKDQYFWAAYDEELYRIAKGEPQSYSPAEHDWVWDEDAAGILIGETTARPIPADKAQEYIDLLEEKYGKK